MIELIAINILIYVQPFQRVFEHGPLGLYNWLVLIALIPTLLIADEIRKFFSRRRHPLTAEQRATAAAGRRAPIIASKARRRSRADAFSGEERS